LASGFGRKDEMKINMQEPLIDYLEAQDYVPGDTWSIAFPRHKILIPRFANVMACVRDMDRIETKKGEPILKKLERTVFRWLQARMWKEEDQIFRDRMGL
jgi:hypothetical protein